MVRFTFWKYHDGFRIENRLERILTVGRLVRSLVQ